MTYQKISTILIWSEDWQKLSTWYEQTFNLKSIEELRHPEDTGNLYEFPDGGPWLWIGQHSQIQGANKDPLRIMFNIAVDSIDATYDDLKIKGVTIIAEPFKAPTFDKWFITFSDPDGNTIQAIGPR